MHRIQMALKPTLTFQAQLLCHKPSFFSSPLTYRYSHANNGENDHQGGVENVSNTQSNTQNDAEHTNPLPVYTEVSSLEFFHERHVVWW